MKIVNCSKCDVEFKIDNWRYTRAIKNDYNLYCNLKCKQDNVINKFWKTINIKSDNDCWEINNLSKNKKYGKIKYKGKFYGSHRFSYILKYGNIEDKTLLVCHKCDNTKCVNPNHLFLGTALDNTRDCINKGRDYVSKTKKLIKELSEEIESLRLHK